MNMLTARLVVLNTILLRGKTDVTTPEEDFKALKTAHDHLVDGLKKVDRKGNYIHDAPDWELYPIARDFFTQIDHLPRTFEA